MQLYKVLKNRKISEGTFVLRTERPRTEVFAGQCFSIGLPELAINREYSIFSSPKHDYLEFLIREVPDGAVSVGLRNLNPGEEIYIGGPYGNFCLKEDDLKDTTYVFIATGTGVAPFYSFIQTFPDLKYYLFHGVRNQEDSISSELTDSSSYFLAVSRPLQPQKGKRVFDLMDEFEVKSDYKYYLCGNRNMITEAVIYLRKKSVPGSSIFMETFF